MTVLNLLAPEPLAQEALDDRARATGDASRQGETLPRPTPLFEVSVIIVSFNTREILRECLASVVKEAQGFTAEILVVDNASTDGSVAMMAAAFPQVVVLESPVNLGFGAANNMALRRARGRYFILLNSDAFLEPGALALAIRHMDETPSCGIGGCRLIGREGDLQPSSRSFHSIVGDAIVLSGLAARFPASKLFGAFDRTWADPLQPAQVDWVPGAFTILRPAALDRAGYFDTAFFLYYEEVDLCLRFRRAGIPVWYWPDIVVVHIGGESSRQLTALEFSDHAAQVVLWRMRSTLLYYRKHHGAQAQLARWMEAALYLATIARNWFTKDRERIERRGRAQILLRLIHQAWRDTHGGRISPPRPW